jgi:hypothetical protein
MKCIFCHKESSNSRSVEHIVPESLGNKSHILSKGCVCDNCNHYFAVKIEKELLEQSYFRSYRFRNEILTKKDKFVKEPAIFPGLLKSTEITMQTTNEGIMASFNDEDIFKMIQNRTKGIMITACIPHPEYPNQIVSRFLAKCAYEYFLYSMGESNYNLCIQEFLSEDSDQLQPIREYARFGKKPNWEYHQRRIYSEGTLFKDTRYDSPYKLLHEMTLLATDVQYLEGGFTEMVLYYILAIGGIEYAICLNNPDISGYQRWLVEHDFHSPLEKATEWKLPIGLSDVNPILFKKDDDRFHK